MIPFTRPELELISQDYANGPIGIFNPVGMFGSAPRSREWEPLARRWLHVHPFCAACGTSVRVEVHHIKPFHLFPDLELDEYNLISLCRPRGCHLWIGHSGSWEHYNPHVIEDAARFLQRIKERLPQ